jgi:hypothetical protein
VLRPRQQAKLARGAKVKEHAMSHKLNTKTAEQLDLQALHRVRERLVRQRTGIINQIRALSAGTRHRVRSSIAKRPMPLNWTRHGFRRR